MHHLLRGIPWPSVSFTVYSSGLRCSGGKHAPKVYSSTNNMDPDHGPIPPQLQHDVIRLHDVMLPVICHMQSLTQVEEMLISAVLPIMSLYRLPHGQYGYLRKQLV